MSDSLRKLFESFEEVRQEAQTMSFMTRALELQEDVCQEARVFLDELADAKSKYVLENDEDAANTVLAMELSLRPVVEELRMWIALKREDPDRAWDHLVDAQQLAVSAIRVRTQVLPEIDNLGIENFLGRLRAIEHVVFPPQVFNSIGGLVRRRECSICGEEYEDCSHIKGDAYMGRVCSVVLHDLDLREVSIVDDPADKRARITHFTDEEGRRSRMTWQIEKDEADGA